jgi:hypothetical protein
MNRIKKIDIIDRDLLCCLQTVEIMPHIRLSDDGRIQHRVVLDSARIGALEPGEPISETWDSGWMDSQRGAEPYQLALDYLASRDAILHNNVYMVYRLCDD